MGFSSRLFGATRSSATSDAISGNTALGRKLAPWRQNAWIPTTREGDCAIAGSKFSGIAFVPDGEAWPGCGNCGQPMQLFLQLNAKDVPAEAKGLLASGILQLFYCTSSNPQCDVECEAYFPFSKAHLARVIEEETSGNVSTSPVCNAFPARCIVGWSKVRPEVLTFAWACS